MSYTLPGNLVGLAGWMVEEVINKHLLDGDGDHGRKLEKKQIQG